MEDEIRRLYERIQALEQQAVDRRGRTEDHRSWEDTIAQLNCFRSSNAFRNESSQTGAKSAIDILLGDSNTRDDTPTAIRIRINSKPIIQLLGEISGSSAFTPDHPVILPAPFKTLIFYDKEIRQAVLKLGNGDGHADSSEPSPTDTDTDSHLQCLVEFMDKYVAPRLSYLEGSERRLVTFLDLWYLFSPGVAVVDENLRQAYSVIGTTCPASGINPLERPYIEIQYVRITSDGKKIGPELHKLRIPVFYDQRDITSFPVFPLRFVNNQELSEFLISRGKTFLGILGIAYMHYSGQTRDLGLEVDSSVMIDTEEAFRSGLCPKEWKPTLTDFVVMEHERDEAREHLFPYSSDLRESVHDEESVDRDRSHVFLQNQLGHGSVDHGRSTLAVRSKLLATFNKDSGPASVSTGEELILGCEVPGFVFNLGKWSEFIHHSYIYHGRSGQLTH